MTSNSASKSQALSVLKSFLVAVSLHGAMLSLLIQQQSANGIADTIMGFTDRSSVSSFCAKLSQRHHAICDKCLTQWLSSIGAVHSTVLYTLAS